MYVSAFGVEDNRISKKMTERKKKILIAAGAGGGGGLLLAGPLGALAGGGGAAGTVAYMTSDRHRHRSDRLSKADGDKKKTKYFLAGAGGYAAGGQVGSRLGARSAGTTFADISEKQRKAALHNAVRGGSLREGVAAAKKVPGASASMHGGAIGSLTGLGLGAGAYALHRHNTDYGVAKAMPDLVGMAGKAGKWVRGEKAAPGTAMALRPVHPEPYVRPSKMSTKRALLLGGGVGAVGAGGIAAVHRDNNR